MAKKSTPKIIDADRSILRFLEAESGLKYNEVASCVALLTDREFEIFNLLGNGVSNREIAKQLTISPKTQDIHRAMILRKLNVTSVALGKTYWLFRFADSLHPGVFEQAKVESKAER